MTPLAIALLENKTLAFSALLLGGADINNSANYFGSLLHLTCSKLN